MRQKATVRDEVDHVDLEDQSEGHVVDIDLNQPYPRYKSWCAVAGFFDGDGSVEERVGQFVVTVTIGFTDNWDRQLLAVRRFLQSQGVVVGGLTVKKHHGRRSAWQLRVSNNEGVLRTAKKLLQHTCKKNAELRAVVDYLEDRITGDELVRRVNREVAIGNKTGKMKTSALPYGRKEGTKLKYVFSLEKAHAAITVFVPEEEQNAIRSEYRPHQMSIVKLSKAHGYSKSVILRILGKRYGHQSRL